MSPPSDFVHRGVRWWLRIQRRFSAIGGQTLAAGVALYAFLAVFAIIVLAVAVLGFLSVGNDHLARDIAKELGLTGDAARIITDGVNAARRSRRVTSIVGVVGFIWVGTTWARSVANAWNAAWRVKGRAGFKERPRGMLWLTGAFVLFAVAGAASSLFSFLPGFLAPLVVLVSLAANTALWLWTSGVLPNRAAPFRARLIAAVFGGVALEVLKIAGGYVVPRYVSQSSDLYGAIGIVFALLLWLLVFGRVLVYVAVIEAEAARSS